MSMQQDQRAFEAKLRRMRADGLNRYFNSDVVSVPTADGKTLRVPIRSLDIPHFRYGMKETGGLGQGDGEVGDLIYDDEFREGREGAGHGRGSTRHDYAELTLEEAADLLGDELELPNLLEKFGGDLNVTTRRRYRGIQTVGPRGLLHFRRTFRQSLLRSIATGDYQPGKPIPARRVDERFRSPVEYPSPATKAGIIYLLDNSGSMYNVLNFLQNVGFWARAWIGKHYEKVESRYVLYDSVAREVSAETFYGEQAGGGTAMGAGLSLAKNIALRDFPEHSHNLYLIHFTDGDCEGMEVTEEDLEWYREMQSDYAEYFGEDMVMPQTGN